MVMQPKMFEGKTLMTRQAKWSEEVPLKTWRSSGSRMEVSQSAPDLCLYQNPVYQKGKDMTTSKNKSSKHQVDGPAESDCMPGWLTRAGASTCSRKRRVSWFLSFFFLKRLDARDCRGLSCRNDVRMMKGSLVILNWMYRSKFITKEVSGQSGTGPSEWGQMDQVCRCAELQWYSDTTTDLMNRQSFFWGSRQDCARMNRVSHRRNVAIVTWRILESKSVCLLQI